MKIENGPTLTYELVYRVLPRMTWTLKDGFYQRNGYKRGSLVMSKSFGDKMYHEVSELMRFKCHD